MKKLQKNLILLEFLSFLISILPIFIVIVYNFDKYVKTGADVVKLGFAGIMAIVFMFLKVIGKLKLPEHRVTTYLLVFLFSYFLGNVIQDLVILSGMALLGEFLDFLLFSYPIKKTKEDLIAQKTAKIISENLKNLNSSEIGRT